MGFLGGLVVFSRGFSGFLLGVLVGFLGFLNVFSVCF